MVSEKEFTRTCPIKGVSAADNEWKHEEKSKLEENARIAAPKYKHISTCQRRISHVWWGEM